MSAALLARHMPQQARLFHQIAARQLVMTALFLMLEIAIVTVMYLDDRETLIDDLVSIEATRIAHAALRGNINQDAGQLSSPDVKAFAIYDEAGTSILTANEAGRVLPAPAMPNPPSITTRVIDGQHFEVTGTRRVEFKHHSWWVSLSIAGDGLEPLRPALLGELRDHALLPLIPLSVLLLLFNAAVVRRMLLPLERAVKGVDALDPAAMKHRLDVPESPVEVRTLVQAINHAIGRLEATLQTLRRFTADAAHELRTPLAAMTLTVDRLQASPEKERLRQDTLAMSRLISQLLDLARADALRDMPQSRVDLHELVSSVAVELAPLALRDGRQLSYHHDGTPQVAGNADALRRAVRNIIENALRYTAPGTEVTIRTGPGPQLSVSDHGPGIPDELREKVFDRFWRAEGHTSGAGLGLSIVRAIMDSSGGKVSIHDAEGGGALVTLTFRRYPADS